MKKIFSNLIVLIFSIFCINTSAQVGVAINTSGNAADSSAIFDVSSSNRGLLIPRMTTNERNSILNPALGLQIFNTDIKCFEFYNGSTWLIFSCGCTLPTNPIAGSHFASDTHIVWNWNTVNSATGYKYNFINDYSTAIDIGSNTSFSQNSLNCGTLYSLYIWAYNNCGCSILSTSITQSTAPCFNCGASSITFIYNGATVIYGTVNGQNNTCWLDRNLGAAQIANAYNDINAYGHVFQWGRGDDGHQINNSPTTTALSTTDTPGHSSFIINNSSPYDWRNPQNNLLWQGVNGINNPCPSGWRLPSNNEFINEISAWSQQNFTGAYNNALKWTASGYRWSGNMYNSGAGYYWSSTIFGTRANLLNFTNNSAGILDYGRSDGLSIRCIKD